MQSYKTDSVVWFNVITTAIAILSFLPTITNLIPEDLTKYVLAGVGVLNIILRIWFTDKPTTKPLGIGK